MTTLVTAIAGGVVVLAIVLRAARAGSRGSAEAAPAATDARTFIERLVLAAALAWLMGERLLPLLGSTAWAGAAMLGYLVARSMEAPRAEA